MKRREFNLSLLAAVPAFALRTQQATSQLRVDGRRVNAHLSELARIGKTAEGGTNRVAYSELDLEARQYTMNLMSASTRREISSGDAVAATHR
jgi:beta-ureidopropionase / N-carbamoyl-L-amino-acid hydrolase